MCATREDLLHVQAVDRVSWKRVELVGEHSLFELVTKCNRVLIFEEERGVVVLIIVLLC